MNKIAYFECPTGIAGDMCLGALVHAGVPLDYIAQKLQLLGISAEYQLRAEFVHRNTQQATKVYVDLMADLDAKAANPALDPAETESPTFDRRYHHHAEGHSHEHPHEHPDSNGETDVEIDRAHHRHLPEIEQIIVSANLPKRVEVWSLAVFRKLAEAEGAVHGISPDEVHFHEVGAADALVDIVGTCLGLDWLDVEEFYFSAMPTGGGTVKAAHGRLAVPTPAVMKLWEMHRVPVYSNGIERELCTPTGTAIACTLARSFGAPPPMQIHTIGLGAGSRNLSIPNILRLWIGERGRGGEGERGREGEGERGREGEFPMPNAQSPIPNAQSPIPNAQSPIPNPQFPIPNSQETICVLETQIDDLNPQAIAYVFDALFAAGALDVFSTPIVMKKSRLGVLLTAICPPELHEACETVIFRETTTLGIRRSIQQRTVLHREIHQVQTPYGAVRIKIAKAGKSIANVQPEYEDCAEIARANSISWREVHRLALQNWYDRSAVETRSS
ncbi:MAG: nickel pincer cofactor biosynthesis protein LarC [Oscillatoriaceae cyanobacterium Prado104]|jgi:hypothetical protein|nr:nickel pincer cofactor biosynthesis protein LarC [Oscillatoriaceae cyanobacterium Prado104]